MTNVKVNGSRVTFCKNLTCNAFEVANATENTTMKVTKNHSSLYLGCSQYVLYPIGDMFCQRCYYWKPLNMTNRAWAVSTRGELVEEFLVCEECSKDMEHPKTTSQALCATIHASQLKPKETFISKLKQKFLASSKKPQTTTVWD